MTSKRNVAMAVIAVDMIRQEPYSDGQSFGATGAYERIDGILTAAVDPEHRANRAIVDLGLAPRDDQGQVRFQADFTLLKPLDTSRGNYRLLVDVVNRGRMRAVPTLNMAPAPPDGSREIPPGDGFLFTQGYAVVSIGWQWDVHRNGALLGLVPPFADLTGEPVHGQVIVEMRPNVVETTRLLADRIHQPYPAADLEDPEAVLRVRAWKDGPATVVLRHHWRFACETAEGVVPSAEHIYLASGFQPGQMYDVVYRTDAAPVVGTGLLAVRDVAAWLRHASGLNPVAEGFERVYALGVSQTGRLLRHFIYLGLNLDESDRLVYDGLLPHIAGGRRGEFNHRFAQPSQQHTPGFGHLFPFADNAMTDPLSGRTDGLLNRLRSLQGTPKILYTNSSAEYWRGDASLLHIDPAGQADLLPAEETRLYHFAGTQHTAGTLPQASGSGPDGSIGRYASNVTDYRPLLRAALINLDRWVSQGIEPPPNCHPRLDDGTAVPRAEALGTFKTIPGLVPPDPHRLWRLRQLHLGPEAARGIGRYPAQEGRDYPCYVCAVDSDGNERAGIRLPDLAVPVATHAGWNPRAPETGAPEQIIPMQGFSIFFAPTETARQASGDPRPAIAERYANRTAYLAQVRIVARQLAAERYILEDDVEMVVSACAARYDAALKHLTAV
jgi:hypothetical protein